MSRTVVELEAEIARTLPSRLVRQEPQLEIEFYQRVRTKRAKDTTEVYEVKGFGERAALIIAVGDLDCEIGPYDGLCWVIIDQSRPWFRIHRLTEIIKECIAGERMKAAKNGHSDSQ